MVYSRQLQAVHIQPGIYFPHLPLPQRHAAASEVYRWLYPGSSP